MKLICTEGRVTLLNKSNPIQVPKPWDWVLKLLYHCEVWQIPRQHCCRGTCQISQWLSKLKHILWLEISRVLLVSHLTTHLNRGLTATFIKYKPQQYAHVLGLFCIYYNDVIMSTMASQITSLTKVYLTVYSGADQRKHQSSASLAFVGGWGGGLLDLCSSIFPLRIFPMLQKYLLNPLNHMHT